MYIHNYSKIILKGSSFRFPLNNPILLEKWTVAMKRADWKPTKHSVLCEKHFQPEDYYITNTTTQLESLDIDVETQKTLIPTKKYLKPTAVPSIFAFPPHLKKTVTSRKPPAQREVLQVPESSCLPETEDNNDHHDNYRQETDKKIFQLQQRLKRKNKKNTGTAGQEC